MKKINLNLHVSEAEAAFLRNQARRYGISVTMAARLLILAAMKEEAHHVNADSLRWTPDQRLLRGGRESGRAEEGGLDTAGPYRGEPRAGDVPRLPGNRRVEALSPDVVSERREGLPVFERVRNDLPGKITERWSFDPSAIKRARRRHR